MEISKQQEKKQTNQKYKLKICTTCQTPLNKNNLSDYNLKHAKYICKACSKKRSQQKYIQNKDAIRKRQKEYEQETKLKIIKAYGGKCACCGETTQEFLTIDHINNDGAIIRKNTKQGTGCKIYRWLIKNNYPKDNYQLLCFNCNMAKGFFGKCPHNQLTM